MLNNLLDQPYRIYRIFVRTLIKHSFDPRPASYPYISGDGFRKLAHHIYDECNQDIIPENVREKEIIFVGDSRIKKFLKEVHPKIKYPYVLVTHNGDEAVDEEAVSMMDKNILKWYGINVTVDHPNIIPIPLGLGNKHYYVTGIPSIFKNIAKKNFPKSNKIFYGFTTSTNKEERAPALEAMERNPYAETLVKWKNFPNYMKLLATYKFVTSPPGSSVEGHRTWEALYVGVIPIVKSSVTTEYFKKVSIPVWVVKDWRELDSITEETLEDTFEIMKQNINTPSLYMEYWANKVLNMEN